MKKKKTKNQTMASRRDKYRPEYAGLVQTIIGHYGYEPERLAEGLGVTRPCIDKWERTRAEFRQAVKDGLEAFAKNRPDAEKIAKVEAALLKRACGYEIEETESQSGQTGDKDIDKEIVKRVHIPGSVDAQKFFLKNRCPDRWKDRQEVDLGGNVGQLVVVKDMSLVEEELRKQKEKETGDRGA